MILTYGPTILVVLRLCGTEDMSSGPYKENDDGWSLAETLSDIKLIMIKLKAMQTDRCFNNTNKIA